MENNIYQIDMYNKFKNQTDLEKIILIKKIIYALVKDNKSITKSMAKEGLDKRYISIGSSSAHAAPRANAFCKVLIRNTEKKRCYNNLIISLKRLVAFL